MRAAACDMTLHFKEAAMPERTIGRHGFLLLGAASGTGLAALLGATNRSKAFEQAELGTNSGVALAYATRCSGASEHAVIISNLRARLAADSSADSQTQICPICDCPVTVSR
jgi:hypothetical protein